MSVPLIFFTRFGQVLLGTSEFLPKKHTDCTVNLWFEKDKIIPNHTFHLFIQHNEKNNNDVFSCSGFWLAHALTWCCRSSLRFLWILVLLGRRRLRYVFFGVFSSKGSPWSKGEYIFSVRKRPVVSIAKNISTEEPDRSEFSNYWRREKKLRVSDCKRSKKVT